LVVSLWYNSTQLSLTFVLLIVCRVVPEGNNQQNKC
jgi:hypothetical protein